MAKTKTRGERLEEKYPGMKFYPDGTPSRKTASRNGFTFSEAAYAELDEKFGDPDKADAPKKKGKKAAEPDEDKSGKGPPEDKGLDGFTNEELEAAIAKADLSIPEEGTGATGNVVKRDLVKVLDEGGKDAEFVKAANAEADDGAQDGDDEADEDE